MAQHEQGNDRRLDDQAASASALISRHAVSRTESESGNAEPPRPDYPQGLGQFISQNAVYVACVAAVTIAVVLLIMFLSRVVLPGSFEFSEPEVAEENASYESPYDWTRLDRTDGRFAYVVDGQVKSRLGVDVSENQHSIDWNAVAADGIDFAMIRLGYRGATEGVLYIDEQYKANLDGAKAAGLDCGIYFFSQARTVDEAVEEADFVLAHLNGTPLEYPIAFDSEEVVLNLEQSRTTGLGAAEMTAIAEAFCDRIEAAGYRSMVYGNAADLSRYSYASMEGHRIWWAEYGAPVPAANIDIVMWQYTNTGQVAGIPAEVDLNIDLSSALTF